MPLVPTQTTNIRASTPPHPSDDIARQLEGLALFTHRVADPVSELTHLLFDGDDHEAIHGTWRRLLATEAFHYRPGLSTVERTELAYERLRVINGLVESPAGLAYDYSRLASLHEWSGVVDGAVGTLAGIHYNLFLGSLLDHDGGGGRDLSEFFAMRRTGTFLCTELGAGNDAAALRTTAEYDAATGEFVLDTPTTGAQKFMPNTSAIGGSKTGLVAARLLVEGEDQGVFLFLTPLSDSAGPLPGVRIRSLPERPGSPVDHCLTSFDRVRLPRTALLEGEHGRLTSTGFVGAVGSRRKRFLHSLARVTAGKLCMSAAAVGVTRASLVIAVRHAYHRYISGPRAGERIPVTRHRSHHGRLLLCLANAYAMTFLHRTLVTRWVTHDKADREDLERLVAIAKGWITWQARAITLECRERCGSLGLFPVNGIAEHPLNLEGTITAEGDNLVIWLKAAGEMLFAGAAERRPRRQVALEEQAITDPLFLRDLMVDVESLWQDRARQALRRGPSGDPIGRWNTASSAALRMVRAHAVLRAADSMQDAAGRAADPTTRLLLKHLCRLFLLQHLSANTGDLLARGLMTKEHVQSLPEAVETLIAALAPFLMTLVDAFNLPQEFLDRIPLANDSAEVRFDQIVETADAMWRERQAEI